MKCILGNLKIEVKKKCMKRTVVLLVLFFTLLSQAKPCLNLFAVDSSGRVIYLEHRFLTEIQFNQQNIEKRINELEKSFKKQIFSMQSISDYGAYLLMRGNFKEGMEIFRQLQLRYPDIYEINANLAVAFEVNGEIDSAIHFQKTAMKLKPSAHDNSEWLHLKILEARKQLLQNSDWCIHNNVTEIEAESIKNYKYQSHETGEVPFVFSNFIAQLNERMPFSFAEDKVMGKLFLELGSAYMSRSVYRAYYCYSMARYFYPQLNAACEEKMKRIKQNYPRNTAKADNLEIRLYENNRPFNEMMPPDDDEVKAFINKVVNRPILKRKKLPNYPVSELLRKI